MDTKSSRGQEGVKPPPVPYAIENNTLIKRKSNHRENSIAISCFFHLFFFGILSSICLNISVPEKPIAIQLSFGSSNEEIEIITDGIDIVSSEESLSELEDSISMQEQQLIMPAVLGEELVENLDQSFQDSIIHDSQQTMSPLDIDINDLMQPVEVSTESVVDNSSNSNDINQNNSADRSIRGLLTGIQNGMTQNTIVQNRAGNGAGGGIENRLASYGAKTGDLQISIAWNTIDDVDLHVMYCANGSVAEHISFASKNGPVTQGFLDIDMNANGNMSRFPVENIFYPTGKTKDGQYHIFLHLYASRTGMMEVPVILRIKNRQKIQTRKVIAQRIMQKVHVETLGDEFRPFSF